MKTVVVQYVVGQVVTHVGGGGRAPMTCQGEVGLRIANRCWGCRGTQQPCRGAHSSLLHLKVPYRAPLSPSKTPKQPTSVPSLLRNSQNTQSSCVDRFPCMLAQPAWTWLSDLRCGAGAGLPGTGWGENPSKVWRGPYLGGSRTHGIAPCDAPGLESILPFELILDLGLGAFGLEHLFEGLHPTRSVSDTDPGENYRGVAAGAVFISRPLDQTVEGFCVGRPTLPENRQCSSVPSWLTSASLVS